MTTLTILLGPLAVLVIVGLMAAIGYSLRRDLSTGRGGHPSSSRPASDLRPPPAGPGPGSRANPHRG